MALGVGTDVLTATPMLGIAIWSHSLTLLADAMRGGLLTLLQLFVYIMLRRIHRRRLPSYEYGSGKIEASSTCSLVRRWWCPAFGCLVSACSACGIRHQRTRSGWRAQP